ncbi:hypothetical protein LINPERPRIM_LOCUS15985 [Linum perenne]
MTSQKSSPVFSPFTNLTIEMVEIEQSTKEYTSLKKLLRTMSPPSIVTSPAARNSSWHDIPLKDQIVKQAAWAYLQPSGGASEFASCDGGGIGEVFRRLRVGCVGRGEKCGCLEWINDVVLEGVMGLLFPKRKRVGCCVDEEEKDGDGVSGENVN